MTHPLIEAFLFDMDGTLIDNMDLHAETWMELLAERGLRLTADEFHRTSSGKTNRETLRLLFGDEMSDAEAAEFTRRKEALYRERFAPLLKAVEGLIAFLDATRRRGLRIALATSAIPPNIDFVLDGLRIRPYFEAVVGAKDITNGKPDPEIFLTAAQRLGVGPERCLVFEDSLVGIEGARRAGMRAVAILTTLDQRGVEGLAHVIQSARDFTALDVARLIDGAHPA